MAKSCKLSSCRETTDHVSSYHSDGCLQEDMAPDYLPPVTVLAPNKAGGFGHDICRMEKQYVHLPPLTQE